MRSVDGPLGDPSVRFTQAAVSRLEQALDRERRRSARWEELGDIAARQADAVVLVLMVGAAAVPVTAAMGDIVLVTLYAMALSLVAFSALYLALPRFEARAAEAMERVMALEAELAELRKPRRPGK